MLKDGFNYFITLGGRIAPGVKVGYFITVDEVVEAWGASVAFIGVYKHKLDLHSFGNYAFYVDCRHTSADVVIAQEGNIVAQLRKSREVGRELDEYAVALDASNYSCDCLPRCEHCRVFLPRAEQLAH